MTSPGPVNCNVVRRRDPNGGAVPRSCERCTLGPCPFYAKDGTQPDGYAVLSRYDQAPGVMVGSSADPHRPQPVVQPERMGYTTDVPGHAHKPHVAASVGTPEDRLRSAFEIALVKTMAELGLEFRVKRSEAKAPFYGTVIEACQGHTNRVLAILRTSPREKWAEHERNSEQQLKEDLAALGIDVELTES